MSLPLDGDNQGKVADPCVGQNLWRDVEELDPEKETHEEDQKEEETDKGYKCSLVSSRMDGFKELTQSLEQVQEHPIPETSKSRDLARLQTGINEADEKISEVTTISDELSIRSAQTSKEFLQKMVVQANKDYLDFEERMSRCERALRTIEAASKREQTKYDY